MHRLFADVAKLVDALDLGSSAFGRGGSSPFIRTKVEQTAKQSASVDCFAVF